MAPKIDWKSLERQKHKLDVFHDPEEVSLMPQGFSLAVLLCETQLQRTPNVDTDVIMHCSNLHSLFSHITTLQTSQLEPLRSADNQHQNIF